MAPFLIYSKPISHMNKTRFPFICTKNKFKDWRPNLRAETKNTRVKHRENISWSRHRQQFSEDMMGITRIDKLGDMKSKNFRIAKKTIEGRKS